MADATGDSLPYRLGFDEKIDSADLACAGLPDIYVPTPASDLREFLINDGHGHFRGEDRLVYTGSPLNIYPPLLCDVNHDGAPDLVPKLRF